MIATEQQLAPPIQPRPEFAGILRDDRTFASGDSDDAAERLNGWFDALIVQSGLQIGPTVLLLLCLLAAVTVGGTVFVVQENLLATAVAAALGGLLPIVAAVIARSRRQKQILGQLPETIDELARAARTGRSLEHCLQLVADDTLDPLGGELKRASRRVQMGIGVGDAVRNLPRRTGVVSLNVLVLALTVHQQAGGDLVAVLERLSRTIRDRIALLGRLRAATIASRATAVLMIAIPPAVLTFFVFRDPDYFTKLMSSDWGRGMTIMAVVLQIIGSAWVLRILKHSRRT